MSVDCLSSKTSACASASRPEDETCMPQFSNKVVSPCVHDRRKRPTRGNAVAIQKRAMMPLSKMALFGRSPISQAERETM